MGNMTIPLQIASLYDRQMFVWSNYPLVFGTDFLVGMGVADLAGNSLRNEADDIHTSRKIYRCVQYFRVFKQWYGCQCLESLTCAYTLMHAVEHKRCMDTARESALKDDSGREVPCRTE